MPLLIKNPHTDIRCIFQDSKATAARKSPLSDLQLAEMAICGQIAHGAHVRQAEAVACFEWVERWIAQTSKWLEGGTPTEDYLESLDRDASVLMQATRHLCSTLQETVGKAISYLNCLKLEAGVDF